MPRVLHVSATRDAGFFPVLNHGDRLKDLTGKVGNAYEEKWR